MSDQVSVRYLHSVRQVDEHEIRSLHFTTIWSDVGKSIQDVGKFICWEVLRLMVSPVDSPYAVSATGSLGLFFDVVDTYQFTKYATALYSVPPPMPNFVVSVRLP